MYVDKFTLIFLITHLYLPCKNLCPLSKVCSLRKFSKLTKKQKPFSLLHLSIPHFNPPFHKISDMFQVILAGLKKPEIISALDIAEYTSVISDIVKTNWGPQEPTAKLQGNMDIVFIFKICLNR